MINIANQAIFIDKQLLYVKDEDLTTQENLMPLTPSLLSPSLYPREG
jgi:hypothetical protein